MPPSAKRPRVDVLRYRYHSTDLEVDVSGVFGYQAVCPCGFRGIRRRRLNVARADLHEHKVTIHGHRP